MLNIPFIPYQEFRRVLGSHAEKFIKLQIVSDMCRLNTISAIKRAGSGHIGSSLSSMDIFVYLYFHEMNVLKTGLDNPNRDIFFSSKGHDTPGQYSVLMAAGVIGPDKLLKLRRLGGLEGHPEITTPGIEANTGSLGMGISKARGMVFAKRLDNLGGRVIVLTGDGELQEGQVWEALQNTIHQGLNNIYVIVDANKIQTDRRVKEIIDLKNLENKLTAFGWHVERCNGHNFHELEKIFTIFKDVTERPKILIADTVKGKGVSFMERIDTGIYRWHSGAPDDESFKSACLEIITRINQTLNNLNMEPVKVEYPAEEASSTLTPSPLSPPNDPLHLAFGRNGYPGGEIKGHIADSPSLDGRGQGEGEKGEGEQRGFSSERVVNAYGKALVEIASERKDIIVLDADLSADCGLRLFEEKFPERFIENGIAEQDMVSMAGGLALQGYLPIVHSFSAFLSSRANEHIFINASEGTKIIYVCNYAGLLPAGPGVSHQGVRDISLLGGLPNCIAMEPCNAAETKLLLNWCVNVAEMSCLLRLSIFPSPGHLTLPDSYRPEPGKGIALEDGKDAVIFAYGPVMLYEALLASDILKRNNISLKVVNMPWLNQVNREWFEDVIAGCDFVFVLDNHFITGGLGDFILNTLASSRNGHRYFNKFAIEGYPECGTPDEVLRYHKLDGESIAVRIREVMKGHKGG